VKQWDWNGARWWKFDFHTHTRASEDYGRGPGQAALKARGLDEWLLDFMRAEVDCVAVTDHNTGAGIGPLTEALEKLRGRGHPEYRELVVFPGVELSVHGRVHVLAIFGPGTTVSTIDKLLGAVECQAAEGKTDGETRKSFVEVVRTITNEGGLAVPAHADNECGLFGQAGNTLKQALQCKDVFAMEVVDPEAERPAMYRELGLEWAEVLGSDAHHPIGARSPGSHFTWVKMGQPTIEGLRLALLDGALSIRRSDTPGGDPNEHAFKVIESIEVRETRFMGRAEPFELTFNPWLNVVIGGRGTGKSTLVEFLRLTLRREDELPDTLVDEFDKYRNAYENRDDDGLLTDLSEIVVTYGKDGGRFRLQWNQTGSLEPIQEQDGAGWRPISGEISRHFPARIYSQKQIFELARAPLSLLRIVDEELDRQEWESRWNEEENRFLSLRAKAREIEAGLAAKARVEGDLSEVKRKLAIFEESGHSTVLKTYQRLQRQRRMVETWGESWSGTGDRLRLLAGDLVPDELDHTLFEGERADVVELAASTIRELKGIRDQLSELAEKADRILTQWHNNRDASAWSRTVEDGLLAYTALCEILEEEGAGDPGAYAELVQRRQALDEQRRDFAARRQEIERVRRDAESSLERLKVLRQELTQNRARFLTRTLSENAYVQIEILPYGHYEGFEDDLRRIVRKARGEFRKDFGAMLETLYTDFSESAAFEDRLDALKTRIRGISEGSLEPSDLRDKRFVRPLGDLRPEDLDRLDALFPEDDLKVLYRGPDGRSYRPIREGSPGQRTAALLAFLLSYGDEPIILDQPEDDLDNRLIYDLIVAQLRQIKQKRQVLVVTHNANIVVNGDAELVVALAARGGESHKQCNGSLQEEDVRNTICDIMEGGREAFDRRYYRIALEGRRV
jgi:AAA domain, putative AbiEii toxin, Type IV TA system